MIMKSPYLKDKFDDINEKLKEVKDISKSNPKVASMLTSYLVVFISGVYEDAVEHLFIERTKKVNDEEITQLVRTLIDQQFRNPTFEKIKDLAKALDTKYGNRLAKIDTKHKEGLNSIVENKNRVAHGGISNATIEDMSDFHSRALKIFEELEKNLLS